MATQIVKKYKHSISPLKKKSHNYSRFFLPFILIITAMVFANTLGNDFIVNWDDEYYILNNDHIKNFSLQEAIKIFIDLSSDNYSPLVDIFNGLIYSFFGFNPTIYHIISILLHLINISLVFYFTFLLTARVDISSIVSLLFAIHPMQTESVSWIGANSNLLAGIFFWGSLIFYLKYLKKEVGSFLIISFSFFICSIISKATSLSIPFIFLIIDYYFGIKINFKSISKKTPFFIISFIFAIITFILKKDAGVFDLMPSFTFFERILITSYSFVFYIFKFFVPLHQSLLHFYPKINYSFMPFEYYLAPLLIIAIIFTFVYTPKELKKDILFGFLFFLINISLFIQLVPGGGTIVAERYAYLPYWGLSFGLARLYYYILKKNETNRIKQKILTVLFVLFLVSLSFITWNRNKIWHDGITLFTDVIKKYPEQDFPYYIRGTTHGILGEYDKAIVDLNEAIRLNPNFAKAFYNRGKIKNYLQDYSGEIEDYTKTIQLNPSYAEAFYNRGNAKYYLNDYSGAIRDYTSVITLKFNLSSALSNRASAKGMLQNYEGSIEDYTEALRIGSPQAETYLNRALIYLQQNKLQNACQDFNMAKQMGNMKANEFLQNYCK